MSNGADAYDFARLFKLWATISKLLLDGKRNVHHVCDALQKILVEPNTPSRYRLIYPDGTEAKLVASWHGFYDVGSKKLSLRTSENKAVDFSIPEEVQEGIKGTSHYHDLPVDCVHDAMIIFQVMATIADLGLMVNRYHDTGLHVTFVTPH